MFPAPLFVRTSEGNIIMRFRTLAALPVIGVLAVAGHAHAATFNFAVGGDGNVTASGTLTTGPDPYANSTFGNPR